MRVREKKTVSIWQGVMILSLASLIGKILSAFYRVPFQNMAGDFGFYVYQQVYPLYGIIAILAMYGFPVVLSKQRATLLAENKKVEAKEITSVLFYGLLILTGGAWLIVYTTADFIAMMMGDERLNGSIRAMSYCLFLLPFISVGRGYHQGNEELVPTAISHLTEQFIRVIFILGFTYFFISAGANAYIVGSGAAYGSLLGGLSGIVMLLLITRGEWCKQLIAPWKFNFLHMFRQNQTLFIQSGFICLSALVLILFQLIDAFTLVRFLQWFGLELNEAIMIKGVYDRGQPLIQLGTVLATTFSLALVPLLSKAVIKKEKKLARFYQHLSYRLTLLIGGVATVGLIVIMKPTNQMLFTNTAGSDVLSILVISICLHSLYTTLTAVLQGYHLVIYPAWAVIIGLVIKAGGNLLFIPIYGAVGAAWSTVLALSMMGIYLFIVLQLNGHLFFGKIKTYIYIAVTLLLLGVITMIWREFISTFIEEMTRITAMYIALSSILVGGGVVIGCLLLLPIFSEEEWKHIPLFRQLRNKIKRN